MINDAKQMTNDEQSIHFKPVNDTADKFWF